MFTVQFSFIIAIAHFMNDTIYIILERCKNSDKVFMVQVLVLLLRVMMIRSLSFWFYYWIFLIHISGQSIFPVLKYSVSLFRQQKQ